MVQDNSLFLETTIQIGRIWGNPEKKRTIEKILLQFEHLFTSTYVKMEFKRRLIRDLAYIFNIVSSANNIADVFFRIEKLPAEQYRKVKGFIASLGNFFSYREEESTSEYKEKDLFEEIYHYFKYIGELAWKKFDNNIEATLNETDCVNAKDGPRLEGDKVYCKLSCKQEDKKCKIVEFFIKNKSYINKILERFSYIENLDNEQKKMKKIIEKALGYPQNMANYNNCSACGDLIISLECPRDKPLFTTNVKHYKPICEEIGKKLL